MRAVALRAYEDTPYGMKPITEVWTDEFVPELDRVLDLPGDETDTGATTDELRSLHEEGRVDDVRVITHTVPGSCPRCRRRNRT